MAEPPSKRTRRTDSAAMWEQSNKSESDSRLNGKSKASTKTGSSRRHDSRSRSRSRSQSKSRSRERDRAKTSTKRRDRDDRDGRDRSRRERDEPRGTKRECTLQYKFAGEATCKLTERLGDSRGRSRSPLNRLSPSTRQRSPPKAPRLARSRERDRDRAKEREKGGKDHKLNGMSRSTPPKGPKSKVNGNTKSKDADVMDGIEEADEETAMAKMMGFNNFRSTKNTKVPGNDKNYGVRKEKTSEYRQYMNRRGGFNRPLSPGA
jgi:U4/U6.U5 tri-snRNP-associated protein 3